jgi:hypothetical protein
MFQPFKRVEEFQPLQPSIPLMFGEKTNIGSINHYFSLLYLVKTPTSADENPQPLELIEPIKPLERFEYLFLHYYLIIKFLSLPL